MTIRTLDFSSVSPLNAAMEIGTRCALSERFWAVTRISPLSASASALGSVACATAGSPAQSDRPRPNRLAPRSERKLVRSVLSLNLDCCKKRRGRREIFHILRRQFHIPRHAEPIIRGSEANPGLMFIACISRSWIAAKCPPRLASAPDRPCSFAGPRRTHRLP